MTAPPTPKVLVIDDLFGRVLADKPNRERINLCAKLLLADCDEARGRSPLLDVTAPHARAVFCRGQRPAQAVVGDTVENDFEGTLAVVRRGWTDALAQGEAPWAMVLLDLCFYTGPVTPESNRRAEGMPEGRADDDEPGRYFGLTLLDGIHRAFPELPVVILSSKSREDISLEFTRRGAVAFIARDDVRGAELLDDALWQHGLLADPEGGIIGNSLPVLLALRDARRAARNRENLLIRGERGSGKELLAEYVHRTGGNRDKAETRPLLTVNSALLTPALASSELFGIEPRTATGVDGKIGMIEAAHGGDLFFDEIADMPVEVQAGVLRVLQERRVTRVGGRQARAVDVRFLSATNVDLEGDASGFRPDLLDRLRLGGEIWLPPLRSRKADIPLLAETFVREAERHRAGTMSRDITPEALTYLLEHEWPGNIRELRACLFDAVSRNPDVEHLVPAHLRATVAYRQLAPRPESPRAVAEVGITEVHPRARATLWAFLKAADEIDFSEEDIDDWAGKLTQLQRSQTWVLARYLNAALAATKRRTPTHPGGVIQIHPAIKLMSGDSTISASKAADLVKRLLGPLEAELEGDLIAAYRIALRLRPKGARTQGKAVIQANEQS